MSSTDSLSNPGYAKDDDEIDLDDENDHDDERSSNVAAVTTNGNPTVDTANISTSTSSNIINNIVIPSEENEGIPPEEKPLSKAEAMKLRMRQLKQKMNQARQLNQQAVREEGEATLVGSSDMSRKGNSKKKNSATSYNNQNSHAIRLAQEHNDIDPKLLLQPAYENLAKQKKKLEKDELNQYAINDYHNPEGQYRNYQRNVKSMPRHNGSTTNETSQNNSGLYDPTDVLLTMTTTTVDDATKQRDGAHRISQELQRRYDKRQMKDRKRKQAEIRHELNETSSSTIAGGSGINLRNQKFNQKVARTYDKSTSEIRHNLERGTAL